jgi:hypothetical protein
VIETQRILQEEQRFQVPRIIPKRAEQHLKEYGQGCKAEMMFNLDEIGLSDWEERPPKRVSVPVTLLVGEIYHGRTRNMKYNLRQVVSLLLKNTSFLISIISHGSDPIREQCKRLGIRISTDVVLKSSSKPSINSNMVLDSIRTGCLPHCTELVIVGEFAEEFHLLLLDS